MSIKAIETVYNGYRFRSRLEARWAVFFDALGLEWEYEKEGFDLGGGQYYLPDFYLPQLGVCPSGVWVEIKGQEPTERELELASRLAAESQHEVFVLSGTVGSGHGAESYRHTAMNGYPTYTNGEDGVMRFWYMLGLALAGWEIFKTRGALKIFMPRIGQAYGAARQARFEHGEAA